MKKILTFAMVAGGALVLSACGGKTEEAPVAEETAAEEMMAAEEPMATDTPAATEEVDPTSNPIPPAATER
jgi:PBP1b-binding outer membrane lipoprotein LpoB